MAGAANASSDALNGPFNCTGPVKSQHFQILGVYQSTAYPLAIRVVFLDNLFCNMDKE
jgi:hypothetical protein